MAFLVAVRTMDPKQNIMDTDFALWTKYGVRISEVYYDTSTEECTVHLIPASEEVRKHRKAKARRIT